MYILFVQKRNNLTATKDGGYLPICEQLTNKNMIVRVRYRGGDTASIPIVLNKDP